MKLVTSSIRVNIVKDLSNPVTFLTFKEKLCITVIGENLSVIWRSEMADGTFLPPSFILRLVARQLDLQAYIAVSENCYWQLNPLTLLQKITIINNTHVPGPYHSSLVSNMYNDR